MNILNNRRTKLSKGKIETQINKMMNNYFGNLEFRQVSSTKSLREKFAKDPK